MSRFVELLLLFLFICLSHSYSFEASHFHSCHTKSHETTSHAEIFAIEEKLSGKNYSSCQIHDTLVQLVWDISSAGEHFNVRCVIDKFREVVCSAPVFQSFPTDSFCAAANTASVDTQNENDEKTKPLFVWLYSFGCVTLISVCSLLGIFILPLTKKSIYNKLLLFFLYLSVGTLTGNAVFHMLPKGFGNHDNIRASVVVSIGIYSFYFLESLLEKIFRSKTEETKEEEDCEIFEKEEIPQCPNALMGSSSLEGSDSFEDYQECGEMNCKKQCQQQKPSFFRFFL